MLKMDINKSFQDGLDKAFGSLASDPNLAGKGNEVFKGRNEFKESEEFFEKWSKEYKDSIDCSNPKGFSQKAFCKGKQKKETKEFATSLVGKTKMNKPIGRLFSMSKTENKEATASSSAGQFSSQLFSNNEQKSLNEMMSKIDHNKLEDIMGLIKQYDPETHRKILFMIIDAYVHDYDEVEDLLKQSNKDIEEKIKKFRETNKEKIPDDLSINDVVKKHSKNKENISEITKKVKNNLKQGIKVELEHTDDKDVAKKIALDHLYEDLEYYSKLKKMETKEATSSASSGQYSTPKMWAKTMKKKDWRGASKTQIPGGKFVTVKEKCKKFPYCNQGDIKALNFFENKRLKEIISNIQNKYNISEQVIKYCINNELNKK